MRYISVCSGIEAASVAWDPLGWKAAAFSEIDNFPRAVLAHHYPDVPCHGDFTTIGADDYGPVDLLVGGTPCQSFSVAGLRGGLGDDRGNLALEYLRLADRKRPRWLVWENVPGVLSSHGGRDFGSILGGMVELGYGVAYRVLDAQYFGVPQRRRRVFVVGYLGDWRPAAAVLLERQSMQGHPPPRRKKGPGIARSLTGSTGGCSAKEQQYTFVGGSGEPLNDLAFGGNDTRGPIDVATAVRAKGGTGHGDFESETFVTSALDASYGRLQGCSGQDMNHGHSHLVPSYAQETADPIVCKEGATWTHEGENNFRTRNVVAYSPDVSSTLVGRSSRGGGQINSPGHNADQQIVAFSCKDSGQDAGEISPTLRSMSEEGGNANAGGQVAVAFDTTQITHPENRCNPQPGDPCHPLASGAHPPALAGSSAVRRLTPRECERLQGFPDDYTAVPYRGKASADGPRYKALGNSMAVPVMRWIGERIDMVEAIIQQEQAA